MKLPERIPDRAEAASALRGWRARAAARVKRDARRPKVAVPVATVVLSGIAVAFGLVCGVVAATLVIVIYTAVLAAIPIIGWKPFEALPMITVGLGSDGNTLTEVEISTDRPQPSIDIEACVLAASERAQRTVEPRPKRRPGLEGLTVPAMELTESYDASLTRFEGELATYHDQLRTWLVAYQQRRWPNYAAFRLPVVIHNGGDSVADGITLNLFLPEGLVPVPDPDLLSVPRPPRPPKFDRRSSLYVAPPASIAESLYGNLARSLPNLHARTGGITGPDYVKEGDQTVARIRIETLTHGDRTATAEPLLVFAQRPGSYTIKWTAHVGNLRRPASGTITADVQPLPDPGDQQLKTVEEVLARKDVPLRQ